MQTEAQHSDRKMLAKVESKMIRRQQDSRPNEFDLPAGKTMVKA